FRPTHIVGYPSSLNVLAGAANRSNVDVGNDELRVIFSNAESLTEPQKTAISQALGATVRNTYGMTETCAAASECTHGRMHIWPEVGVIEMMNNHSEGTGSPLITTGLLNEDMLLIRYVVGDRGQLDHGAVGCACGRGLPLLAGIDGRSNDVIVGRDGRRIFWVNPVFYNLAV